jgi:hypothetical protein
MNIEVKHVFKEMMKTVAQQLICAGLFLVHIVLDLESFSI